MIPDYTAERHHAEKDRALWVNVILRAALDSVGIPTSNSGDSGITRLDRDRARVWLTVPSEDFNEVCQMAGMEPNRVRAQALCTIEEADRREAAGEKPVQANHYAFLYADEIRSLAKEGLDIAEIASKTGLSMPTVRKSLYQHQHRGVVPNFPSPFGDRRGEVRASLSSGA